MEIDLNPQDLRIILKWWESSSEGIFGSLGGIATLRSITLADRLAERLSESSGAATAPGDGSTALAILQAEGDAARVLGEVADSVRPELARRGYEFVYAGIAHALPRDDPRYWSVADLQIERVGAERPTYEFLADDIPVWREGGPCLGEDGGELRRRLVAVIEGWVAQIGGRG